MMPDITMCSFSSCLIKSKCYRFTAVPCSYQSYLAEKPYKMEDNKFSCEFFWGENSEWIMNNLIDITNGTTDGPKKEN